jgi:hypothetical protein
MEKERKKENNKKNLCLMMSFLVVIDRIATFSEHAVNKYSWYLSRRLQILVSALAFTS